MLRLALGLGVKGGERRVEGDRGSCEQNERSGNIRDRGVRGSGEFSVLDIQPYEPCEPRDSYLEKSQLENT